MNKNHLSAFCAVLAAALYALNSPLSKMLLQDVAPTMMASLLYLGAGLGMMLLGLLSKVTGRLSAEKRLTRKDLPFTLGMIVLDILAPILLMLGLERSTAANVSLLNSFEIVATSLIALLIFRESISRRLWAAIGLITLATALLSLEDAESLRFSIGSVFVLLACCCWGLENNCTRMLSYGDPQQIVVIKGLGSGAGSMLVAILTGAPMPPAGRIPLVLLLGFVAYGLSIYFYVCAQRHLGAARTSAYYAVQPFIGVLLSLILLHELPGAVFFAALALMAVGTWLVAKDQQSA